MEKLDFGLIGQRIKEVRSDKKLTQEYLAEKVQLYPTSISRLENGHMMVKLETIYAIAQVLDVGLQDLLCDLFTYSKEDAKLHEELNCYISNMSTSELQHLLEYVKLFKKFVNK